MDHLGFMAIALKEAAREGITLTYSPGGQYAGGYWRASRGDSWVRGETPSEALDNLLEMLLKDFFDNT